MGRKKKEVVQAEDKAVAVQAQGKTFEYGDLAVVCKCGRTQILQKGIQHGFQIIMSTNEASYIQLKCDSCEADMKLCFLEGEKPAEPEVATPTETQVEVNEGVQEEDKQEQSL